MVGAVAVQFVIVHKPGYALLPGGLLVLIVAVWYSARR
jgi:hypothetical protein